MNKIYKYPLKIVGEQVIYMPRGAEILHVDNQRGELCLWAVVDPARDDGTYVIEIVGTGMPFRRDRNNKKHLGTVQMGELVWHVFLRDCP